MIKFGILVASTASFKKNAQSRLLNWWPLDMNHQNLFKNKRLNVIFALKLLRRDIIWKDTGSFMPLLKKAHLKLLVKNVENNLPAVIIWKGTWKVSMDLLLINVLTVRRHLSALIPCWGTLRLASNRTWTSAGNVKKFSVISRNYGHTLSWTSNTVMWILWTDIYNQKITEITHRQ